MPDTLNLSPLAVFQTPASPRADSAQAAPAEWLGDLAAAGGMIPSFADLIKAKSAPGTDSSLDVTFRPDAPETSAVFAVTIGNALHPENPLVERLLTRLTSDVAGNPLTATDDLAMDASVVDPALPGLVPQEIPPKIPSDIPPGIIPLAMPTIPVVVTPIMAATKTEGSQATVAVPPAPTFMVPDARQRGLPAASVVPGHAPAQGAESADGGAPFAASAANSAEVGKSGSGKLNPVSAGEFRPVFERVTDASGNIFVQGTQPQTSPQSLAIETPQLRITTPFAQAGWVQEVDQSLHWMVGNTRQQADLVLNPPDLGRIEVTLVIQGDEVSASFASPHQAVREAIEESLVRLRESLSDSGINLGQTHVGRDSSRDAPFMKADGDGRQGRGARQEGTMPIGTPLAQGSAFQSRGRGMVDVFA